MRGCRASLVAAVLPLAATIASTLGAAEPTNDGAPGVVVFAVDPKSQDAQAMVDAVRAHLTGLPVRLVIETGTSGGSANSADASKDGARRIGTLSIDPGTPGEWVVSFTEPSIDTTLVRRIRLKPQGKRVALEEAAIVVRSMVEAILDGGHVGIARVASSPDEEMPQAGTTELRQPRHGIAGQASYIGTTFASGLGWQSGGVIGLRWQFGELYAGIAYTIFPSILTDTPQASLLLIRHPGAIVLGYEGAARFAPTFELDLIADYIQRTTFHVEKDLMGTAPDARWSFGVGAQGGISWSIVPRVRLFALGGIDWMINPYSYVINPSPAVAPSVIIPASSVRPKMGVGLVVDLW